MRTPIIAGNWKMHKTLAESVDFVNVLAPKLAQYTGVERVVAPTYIAIGAVAEALKNTDIQVSAQDAHWEDSGAFTSQISPTMLQGIADYVIIGHSECRAYLNETDENVNRKAKALIAHGLKPIIAVGESLETNEAGETESFVTGQVTAALKDISAGDMAQVVIAYEPIWAIGTGDTCAADEANRIIGKIRAQLVNKDVPIQYGGSVNPTNVDEIMAQPEIDGALVGGASLEADSFARLANYQE